MSEDQEMSLALVAEIWYTEVLICFVLDYCNSKRPTSFIHAG